VDDETKCPVSGKRKYATEGEALSTAAHQISTANAPKLRAYVCQWCHAWHLTKDTSKTSAASDQMTGNLRVPPLVVSAIAA
jgi:hypothetical protein